MDVIYIEGSPQKVEIFEEDGNRLAKMQNGTIFWVSPVLNALKNLNLPDGWYVWKKDKRYIKENGDLWKTQKVNKRTTCPEFPTSEATLIDRANCFLYCLYHQSKGLL